MLRRCAIQGGQGKIKSRVVRKKAKKSRVGPKKGKYPGKVQKRQKNPGRVHKIDRKFRVGLE